MALQIFNASFGENGEHRASLTARMVDGDPWFKGVEAASALGYTNPQKAIRDHVDLDDKTTLQNLRVNETVTLTNPNEGAAVCISESGLYSLIMSSKLPHSKAFRRWALKDVLPTIRRHGSYSTSPAGQLALSEQHHKAIRDAVHEALESLGQQRGIRIDAKEILLRRGHSQQEALRLCTEFGRAMIAACERTGRSMAPIEGGVR